MTVLISNTFQKVFSHLCQLPPKLDNAGIALDKTKYETPPRKVKGGLNTNQSCNDDLENPGICVRCFILNYSQLFFVPNMILMISGIAVMIIFSQFIMNSAYEGIDLTENKALQVALVPTWGKAYETFQDWISPYFIISVIAGFLITMTGTLGLVAALTNLKSSWAFQGLYSTFLVIIMLEELFTVIVIYSGNYSTVRKTIQRLQKDIKTNYKWLGEDTFSVSLNLLMINGECCGIDGPNDFNTLNITFNSAEKPGYTKAPGNVTWPTSLPKHLMDDVPLEVPPACCKKQLLEDAKAADLLNCAMGDVTGDNRNLKGCYEQYLNTWGKKYGIFAFATVLFLIFVEAFLLFLSVMRMLQGLDSVTAEEADVEEDVYYMDEYYGEYGGEYEPEYPSQQGEEGDDTLV